MRTLRAAARSRDVARITTRPASAPAGRIDVVPGVVTEQPVTSEQNPRAFYKRWADYMDMDSWGELLRCRDGQVLKDAS